MKRYTLDFIGSRHYGCIRKEEKTAFAVLMELICFLRKFKFRIYYLEFGHETLQPPMTNFFAPRTTPESQPSIKSALATKEQKDVADLVVGNWWFATNIPVNATISKTFQMMADASSSIGPWYKLASYDDVQGMILRKVVEEINGFMEHYKSSWSENRCSIMADGWPDGKQRTLIIFLVMS